MLKRQSPRREEVKVDGPLPRVYYFNHEDQSPLTIEK